MRMLERMWVFLVAVGTPPAVFLWDWEAATEKGDGEAASKASKVHCEGERERRKHRCKLLPRPPISCHAHPSPAPLYLVLLHSGNGPLADLTAQDIQPHAGQVLEVLPPQLVPAWEG